MKRVLVTGSNGQLGSELQHLSVDHPDIEFIFTDLAQLDITSKRILSSFFENNKIEYCINCAAYTAVDKAEEESDLAGLVNATAAEYLAELTELHGVKYIHISTDFVFSGSKNSPYNEQDIPEPVNHYGASKLLGEQKAISKNAESLIIRTSWLYSSFGNNFVKTMLKLSNSRDELSVINDQIGTPTYARDLANAILKIVGEDRFFAGIYHYSNEGVASWYDFAHAIFEQKNIDIKLNPIPAEQYPTPAKRPIFSVMNKTKARKTFDLEISHWKESLKVCLALIED